ncbi:MAG: methylenetetrahydrofolate--tRNA-(uracil(54)-C(5))-methyltransferase (FADH(2)-oxidizing) TrmFO [Clostridia bacterium]|nr:methylenetetrahydrofolate--tRNA-(uracil(54)-C(5))-methyltransferase (FADH(2)-oxidizing) TrmFO [Clostridia bacterium]MBO7296824.1 methylenetetrahydrofolate--tRNA-(uracil(54)-C(5))-methyltransferase (FADH(2)-oxidizing) TrmFO [Clostridia bacterium]
MEAYISVLGAGLAGCEAAFAAAERGVKVKLYEMKPVKYTPAHHAPTFGELVCSNSLRSDAPSNAIGLLKSEMRRMGSLIMQAADATRVPAGSALAVDRVLFSEYITDRVRNHPNIEVIECECDRLPDDGVTVIATGPLTSEPMADYIRDELGCAGLHFFDAAAPIVDADSINMDVAFFASRYDKGDADYINCPMTKEQYDAFYEALITAEEATLKDFDREQQKDLTVFEGCMPVEVMARRGYETLCYGPLKPVGLIDPRVGKEYYAVVQLRKENAEGTMYNLVGFQTHLTFPEQRRVFRMIPGLENAEFLRYGVMHRNTYLNSPGLLCADYSMLSRPNVFFAGQMTGVEGYIESAGSGLVAGINAARRARGMDALIFPRKTMIGAMAQYVQNGGVSSTFVPMNANFGIIEMPAKKVKGGKTARNAVIAETAIDIIKEMLPEIHA